MCFAISLLRMSKTPGGVNGAAWPTWAYCLDKGLKRLEGVKKTQLVITKPVHIEISLSQGVWIDSSIFTQQIKGAEYEARKDEIKLTLIGTVVKEGDVITFTLSDVKPKMTAFTLQSGKIKKNKEQKQLD